MFIEMKKAKRRYTLRARAGQVAETRARIITAIMQLHQEVGPRNTTVSAIADRASVERLTVYRHFQDEAEMFAACSHRYLELNPPPDPAAWAGEPELARRVRRGLEELYAFFGRTSPRFEKVYRDVGEHAALKKIMAQFDAHLRKLADALAAARPGDQKALRRQVILRHAVKFATWQSLEAEGVDDRQKIALIIQWISADLCGGPEIR
jgi:AcrR family transcriptional regulator